MPLYDFKCEDGHLFDEFLKLDEYDNPVTCQCGKSAKRQVTATMINFDIPNWDRYISPSTGKLITSYKERRQDMKESDCIDYDPGMRANAERIKKQKEKEFDARIDETVEKQILQMSSDQRDNLAKELTTKDIAIQNL